MTLHVQNLSENQAFKDLKNSWSLAVVRSVKNDNDKANRLNKQMQAVAKAENETALYQAVCDFVNLHRFVDEHSELGAKMIPEAEAAGLLYVVSEEVNPISGAIGYTRILELRVGPKPSDFVRDSIRG